MATYVGMLQRIVVRQKKGTAIAWRCALTADTEAELHLLANRLQLGKAGATRNPHTGRWSYSLSPGNREKALALGALEKGHSDPDKPAGTLIGAKGRIS